MIVMVLVIQVAGSVWGNMDFRSRQKTNFNPERSYYHSIIVKKYIRLGFSKRVAFNKARKEYLESLKFNRLI